MVNRYVCLPLFAAALFVAASAQAQIVRSGRADTVPPNVNWPAEAMSYCKSYQGDTEIEPIYVDGYLVADTARCGSACFEPILKGEFEYLEMIIDKPVDRTKVEYGSFWPENGTHILTRRPAGHKSCVLFDEMMALMRQSKMWKPVEGAYASLLENYCVGIASTDNLRSEYGVRAAMLFSADESNTITQVEIHGEEIFVVASRETHAAQYNVTFRLDNNNGSFGSMTCSPKKYGRNNLNLKKAFKPLRRK